jgi:hypothetical protein
MGTLLRAGHPPPKLKGLIPHERVSYGFIPFYDDDLLVPECYRVNEFWKSCNA